MYKKTIYSTSKTGSLDITNIDFLRWKNFNANIGNRYLFPNDRYVNSTDYCNIVINKSSLTFTFELSSLWTNFIYLVFDIEYTKTTD